MYGCGTRILEGGGVLYLVLWNTRQVAALSSDPRFFEARHTVFKTGFFEHLLDLYFGFYCLNDEKF